MKNPQVLQMNCPSCGASIPNNPNADSITCQYCGNTVFFDKDGDGVPDHMQKSKQASPQENSAEPRVPTEYDRQRQEYLQQRQEYVRQQLEARRRNTLVVPLIGVFFSLVIGGVIAFVSIQQQRQQQKRAAEIAKQVQQQAQTSAEKQLWLNLVNTNRAALPSGFDDTFAQMPPDWPQTTLGDEKAPVKITWYITYVGMYEKLLLGGLRTAMQNHKDKVFVRVLPLPTRDGTNSTLLEAILEITAQKGASSFAEMHELLVGNPRILPTQLCETMDCDAARFSKAMKNHAHAGRIKAMQTPAKKLNLTRQTVVRIENDLFIDTTSVYAQLETAVHGYLNNFHEDSP